MRSSSPIPLFYVWGKRYPVELSDLIKYFNSVSSVGLSDPFSSIYILLWILQFCFCFGCCSLKCTHKKNLMCLQGPARSDLSSPSSLFLLQVLPGSLICHKDPFFLILVFLLLLQDINTYLFSFLLPS